MGAHIWIIRWCCFLTVCGLSLGCGSAELPAPPSLPPLKTAMPGPPTTIRPVIDQESLELITTEGDAFEEIAPEESFRALFRFHLVSSPKEDVGSVRVRVIAYEEGIPTSAWSDGGRPIGEDGGFYRFEAELKSPPKTGRQYFVRAELTGSDAVIELPLVIE